MMTQLSKLLNISHEDVFNINKEKDFLVDQRMTRNMAMGKEDEEMTKKQKKQEQQGLMKK